MERLLKKCQECPTNKVLKEEYLRHKNWDMIRGQVDKTCSKCEDFIEAEKSAL